MSVIKANYDLQERGEIASRELGLRIPVLQRAVDPFFPIDCWQQWWLIEASLTYPEELPDYVFRPFTDYEGFAAFSSEYFVRQDSDGNLQFPTAYEIEQKYSQRDQAVLRQALRVAYKYADINMAIRDGYAPQPYFDEYMGIHLAKLSLYDETIDMQQPEFLVYLKSQHNNAYTLSQLGYIQTKQDQYEHFRYPLFETPEAHGHNHFLHCVYVDEFNWWKQITFTNDEPSGDQEEIRMIVGSADRMIPMPLRRALAYYDNVKRNKHTSPYEVVCSDTIWMMHIAINLYNEEGLFSDQFPLLNTMTQSGELYSFFGRKFDLTDYGKPANQYKSH